MLHNHYLANSDIQRENMVKQDTQCIFLFAIYMQKFNNIAIPSQPAKNMPNDSNLSIAAFQLLAFSLRKTLITGFLDNNITYIDSSKQRNDMLTQ